MLQKEKKPKPQTRRKWNIQDPSLYWSVHRSFSVNPPAVYCNYKRYIKKHLCIRNSSIPLVVPPSTWLCMVAHSVRSWYEVCAHWSTSTRIAKFQPKPSFRYDLISQQPWSDCLSIKDFIVPSLPNIPASTHKHYSSLFSYVTSPSTHGISWVNPDLCRRGSCSISV